MFTFSAKSQSRPALRFQTFNGWTGTIERMRTAPSPPAKPRKAVSWLRRVKNPPKPTVPFEQSTTPPLPQNYPSFPLVVGPMSSRPAETTVPLYGKDHRGFSCTNVVLVASTDASRPYRIRRINTRKGLPWMISKPLPPLPSPPADSTTRLVTPSSSSSVNSYKTTPRHSLQDTFDDGLDDLSLFLRRIAYDVISASTIHRHLGYMEDGERVLILGRPTRCGRRTIRPPRRYSSLMGVSLAIMEGRLPKALMAMDSLAI